MEHYMKTVVPPMAAPPMSAEIQFFVKLRDGRITTVKAKCTDTVKQVKDQIYKSEGLDPKEPYTSGSMMTYGARILNDDSTLADYDIGEGATLTFTVKRHGG